MNADELQQRTRSFALRVIKLVDALPNTIAGRGMGRQLLDSATSVSANYRAARRARSRKEFVAKISIVAEESDESEHWLDLIMASGLMNTKRVLSLHQEAGELMKIFAATRKTTKSKSPDRQIAKSPNGSTKKARNPQ